MSAGRIMTLSVESLNKLYFQFLQLHVAPHLPLPHSEFTQLLTRKTAYEVHRYLEDLMHSPGPSDYSLNGSNSPFASSSSHSPSNNAYQYALPTSADGPTYSEHTHAFNKSIDKKDEDKKGQHNKMGLRRALTGAGFEERTGTYDFKNHRDDTLLPIPGLSQSIGNDILMPVPSLNQTTSLTQSIGNDMMLPLSTLPSSSSESKEYGDKGGSGGLSGSLEWASKGRVMREWVGKIGRVFNDNHSKIQKYSRKMEAQDKLFNLNTSTKLDPARLQEYQFSAKQDLHLRKF